MNSTTQNTIENACAATGYNSRRDSDDSSKLTIKEVFAICREKFCSINGAPIGSLVDDNLRKERAMLAQAETETKVPIANHNDKPDKSDGLYTLAAMIKKEFTLAQSRIAKLKNQLHQAKENKAKERAERGSKSKKEDSQVGSKRVCQQAKRAKASRPGPSPPNPPRKGFKMLLTGDYSDSEEEEDYPEQNVRPTYAKAKFAHIQPNMQPHSTNHPTTYCSSGD